MSDLQDCITGLQRVSYHDKMVVDQGSLDSALVSTYILGSDLNGLKVSVNGLVDAVQGLAFEVLDDQGGVCFVPMSSFTSLSGEFNGFKTQAVSMIGQCQQGIQGNSTDIQQVSGDLSDLLQRYETDVTQFNSTMSGQVISGFQRMLSSLQDLQEVQENVQGLSGIVLQISSSGISSVSSAVVQLSSSIGVLDQVVQNVNDNGNQIQALRQMYSNIQDQVNGKLISQMKQSIQVLKGRDGFLMGEFDDSSEMLSTVREGFYGNQGAEFMQQVMTVNGLNNSFIQKLKKVDRLA